MLKDIDPAAAVGWFLAFFGALVLVAIAFTEGTRGQVTNAVCGAVLIAIGGVLIRTKWGGEGGGGAGGGS